MKLAPDHFTTTMTALAASITLASAASCSAEKLGNIGYRYDIWGENVDDIPGTCGGLWDNLKRWSCAPSVTYCGGDDASNILNWKFQSTIFCNPEKVESTWWEATQNRFGGIECGE